MRDKNQTNLKDEQGFTLAEVLASVVIFSIVLFTFLMIFTQSVKTNRTSEQIVDATYIAQREMETMYALSRVTPISKRKNELVNNQNYIHEVDKQFTKEDEELGFKIIVTFEDGIESDLTRVIIKVTHLSNARSSAQMENLYEWRAEDDT